MNLSVCNAYTMTLSQLGALLIGRSDRKTDSGDPLTELGQIVDAIAEIILITDGEVVLFANSALHSILGWTSEELVGSPTDRIGFDPRELPHGPVLPESPNTEVDLRHSDGSSVRLRVLASGSLGDTGYFFTVFKPAYPSKSSTASELGKQLIEAMSQGAEAGEQLLAAIACSFDFDEARLWTVETGGKLRQSATWRRQSNSKAIPSDAELPSRVVRNRMPEWALGPHERGSEFAFPITANGRPVGVVHLTTGTARHADAELDRVAAWLAEPLGRWAERVTSEAAHLELVARFKLAEQRQRFLAEAGAVLASSLDQRTMLEELARATVRMMATGCAIDLLGDDGTVVRAVSVVSSSAGPVEGSVPFQRSGPITDDGAVGRVLRTGLPILYPRVSSSLLRVLSDVEGSEGAVAGTLSAILVPLPGPKGVMGVVTFITSVEADRAYGQDDLALAEDLGRRTGLALSAALVHERERTIAETLQRSLLPPQLPAIPGAELAARFRPGADGTEVGGDFYDAFPVGDASWMIGIGDVCGHGAAAAALTSQVRYSARAVSGESVGPGQVLESVNRLLLADTTETTFCSAVYAQVRPRPSGLEVTMARAGHPMPVLVKSDGDVEILESSGTILGVFEDLHLEELVVEMKSGDTLVLYTDGITEARRGKELFGTDRLVSTLSSLVGADATTVAESIEAEALALANYRIRDDIALLVLRAEKSG